MPAHTRLVRRLTRAVLAVAVAASVMAAPAASAANPPTPGNFTGYGFDQCLAPSQSAMDAWLSSSPFWAVGIYISGDSRACRYQPNLTPAWIGEQLRNGWRLLPITLGPQASCSDRFPRYGDDETIDPRSASNYREARRQGRREASDTVAVARSLGIVQGSTLWYDLEAYDIGNRSCRESALYFTSAWTAQLHRLGYVSGVYSSAASHILAMDDARVDRPGTFALPDRIWIARWDEVANTSTGYVREDGWRPGGRMKQYRGGHNETHGGVTINIDSNFLDLGRGSVARPERAHCGGVRLNFRTYPALRREATGSRVRAAQCLLTQTGFYSGPATGTMDSATRDAVRAYRLDRGLLPANRNVGAAVWTALHSEGRKAIVKHGAAGEMVRRLQRSLNAATGAKLAVDGTFAGATTSAVASYQRRVGAPDTGVVTVQTWSHLQRGER
ncbi:MAG TPA: glycoside hydrolase domain-containing protein [Marmoricola sp.]|nr:glycoside hydrolase domain-containing protein [Marmoricola sp.]